MLDIVHKAKPLSEVTTLGIGGPARYFIEVKEIDAMQKTLSFCHENKISFFVLGKGSNCLFSDKGFDGLVILNKIDFIEEKSPLQYRVGAGYSFSLLGIQTARKGESGLEFASGIPATVGGAVFMNAGAQGGETWGALQSIEFVDHEGHLKTFRKEELQFGYRFSSFQKMQGAIVAATFQLVPLEDAKVKQRELLDKRIKTQPYQDKSAGCVFRNPLNTAAGALIDKCGLKGFSVGGATVSEMHANFLVNKGGASCEDMLALIDTVRARVKKETGVELEHEIRIIV